MKLSAPALALLATFLTFGSAGCATAPSTESGRQRLGADVSSALQNMMTTDPSLRDRLDSSAGYAIFPSVGKGGFGLGAAYGQGHVYEGDQWIGYSDVTQGTIGAQAGGQTFHELIVFRDKVALNNFKSGQYALAANASAVALKSNAAASADFSDGVIVFIQPEGGLMFEAAIGGQKFSFKRR